MENEFWLNLSSKNLPKAKEFFIKLGFTMNDLHLAPHMVSMFIGSKKSVLTIFGLTRASLEKELASYFLPNQSMQLKKIGWSLFRM